MYTVSPIVISHHDQITVHTATVKFDRALADRIQSALDGQHTEFVLKEGCKLFDDLVVEFGNDVDAELQFISEGANDKGGSGCYINAILFDHGSEIECLEVCCTLADTFIFDDANDGQPQRYVVTVRPVDALTANPVAF